MMRRLLIIMLLGCGIGSATADPTTIPVDTQLQLTGRIIAHSKYGLLVELTDFWCPESRYKDIHYIRETARGTILGDWPRSYDVVLLGGHPKQNSLADRDEVCCVAKFKYISQYQAIGGNTATVRYFAYEGPPRLASFH